MTQPRTDYADYLLGLENDSLHSVEVRSIHPPELDVLRVSQTGGRNDPANSDYIIALPLRPLPRGQFDFGCGRFEGEAGHGTALIEPPGVACLYDLPSDADVEVLAVSLSSARVQELSMDGGGHPGELEPLHAHLLHSPELLRLVEALWEEVSNGAPNGALYGDGALLSLVGTMKRLAGRGRTGSGLLPRLRDPRFQRALDWIEANLAADIRLAHVASAAGMSESSVTRMFRAELSCAPIQHIQRRRVERAAERLRSDDTPIIEVAASVGYDNPQYFATLFRRRMGVSPSQFRKAVRGNSSP